MSNNINGAKYRDASPSVIERVLPRREITTDGCWLWTGAISHDGYGYTRYRRHDKRPWVYVHRLAYIWLVGELDDSMEVDHRCHDPETCTVPASECPHRRCFNPDHLEAVTGGVNVRRSGSPPAINAAKKRCGRGHLLDEANTYVYQRDGSRQCRACYRDGRAAWYAANRDKINAQKNARRAARKKRRYCKQCGVDISHRAGRAVNCEQCRPPGSRVKADGTLKLKVA